MDGNKLAKTITKAGILLVENGAEIVRVEDTMQRIAKAYGASVVDAYATPTLLIISLSLPNSTALFHNIKRVHMKDFPAIVVIDSQGNDLYETAIEEYCKE